MGITSRSLSSSFRYRDAVESRFDEVHVFDETSHSLSWTRLIYRLCITNRMVSICAMSEHELIALDAIKFASLQHALIFGGHAVTGDFNPQNTGAIEN